MSYQLSFRRAGRRWWVTLSTHDGRIVGGNTTWTRSGARRWARRRAGFGLTSSGSPDWTETL